MTQKSQMNFNLKLPSEWGDKLTELALAKNQEVESLIVGIIGEYLDCDYDSFQLQNLQEELGQLKARIELIEEQDYQVDKLINRFNILEKLVVSLQTQTIKSQGSNLAPIEEGDEEEIYDEPDEILTDFLL